MTDRRVARAGLAIALGALVAGPGVAQTTPEQLRPTLDLLGDFDYAVRMEASRTVRRAPPEVAVPLLVETVSQHPDSYVQFRAIVLLDGFSDARGNRNALDALFETGQTARGAARAPIALALGTVALRSPDIVRAALEERPTPDADLLLLRDAFDMLDEDFAEERFYVLMRSAYWSTAEGSDRRRVTEAAIEVLEF